MNTCGFKSISSNLKGVLNSTVIFFSLRGKCHCLIPIKFRNYGIILNPCFLIDGIGQPVLFLVSTESMVVFLFACLSVLVF